MAVTAAASRPDGPTDTGWCAYSKAELDALPCDYEDALRNTPAGAAVGRASFVSLTLPDDLHRFTRYPS